MATFNQMSCRPICKKRNEIKGRQLTTQPDYYQHQRMKNLSTTPVLLSSSSSGCQRDLRRPPEIDLWNLN